jgi:hypothetical protein
MRLTFIVLLQYLFRDIVIIIVTRSNCSTEVAKWQDFPGNSTTVTP